MHLFAATDKAAAGKAALITGSSASWVLILLQLLLYLTG